MGNAHPTRWHRLSSLWLFTGRRPVPLTGGRRHYSRLFLKQIPKVYRGTIEKPADRYVCFPAHLLGAVTLPAASEVTTLQAKDGGQEIQVKAGAIIVLSLEEQAGTGYQWEFDRLDEQHFELVKTETRPWLKSPGLEVRFSRPGG